DRLVDARHQRGLDEPLHGGAGQILLIREVPVQHGFGDADLGGDLIHPGIPAALADGGEGAVHQLLAPIDLVLLPATFAAVDTTTAWSGARLDGGTHGAFGGHAA